MKTSRSIPLLFVCLLLLALAGCGNKGDLVRPGSAPPSANG